MKLFGLAAIALCLCTLPSVAQNVYNIKGATVDTALKINLTSSITVMDAKDSILYKFTRAANDGSFSITGLPAGRFIMLVTYPDYVDFVERFTLGQANKEYDWGNIKMSPKARLLQEVIIKSEVIPIKINGDTTNFNPKAYVIQPNDKVEDLLRQLPGIQIDKDGKITAQGEPVPKVLLDGEEFFGDDPKLVTRNIRADMVGNIQLYDKKSDQAAFTGIDDGVRTKTINIQLKEDKKTGLFGKIEAGIGNSGYYEGQGIYNKFKAKEKFALYGTISNDGKVGLGLQDNDRIGTGAQIGDDGGSITNFGGGGSQLDNETYFGRGLPQSKTAGVHYDNKWDKDSETINTNYKIGSLDVSTDQNSLTTRILTSSLQNTAANSHSDSYNFRQKLDAIYTKTFSPESNIKINVAGTEKNTENNSNGASSTTNGDGSLISRNTYSDDTKTHSKIFNADAFYSKRFKKAGRTISWDVNGNYSESNSTDYNKSDYYTQINAKYALIDQYIPINATTLVLNSNITYTEPLTKKFALTFNYGFRLNNTVQDKESYNQSSPGIYNILDSVTSNNYKYNVLTNQLGAVFNYRGGTKTVLTFGTRANSVQFKQINEFTGSIYKRDFIDWRPQVTFQYRPANSITVDFKYNGNSTQPTIFQIQPVTTNTDAQNLYIGNANLQPSFSHSFNLIYYSVKQLTGQSIDVNGSFSFKTNAIISNIVTDTATAKTVTQYINLTNKTPYNYNLSVNMGWKITALDMQVKAYLNTSGDVGYSYNNNALNANKIHNYSALLNLSKYKQNKYSISLFGGPNYTFQENVLQEKTVSNNSPGYNIYAYVTIFLPYKFQIQSTLFDSYQGKTQLEPATDYAPWSVAFSKTFLKEQNLKFSLACNNILNQEQNSRYSTGNVFTQSTGNSIKRYFMFSISWDFTKFGTTPAKN